MINIDVSVVIQVINFIFLIWILNLVLYKPIRKILLQRKEKLAGLEQGIDEFKADAGEKDAAFAAGIKTARTRGLKEKGALLDAAAEEEQRIIDKINEKAQADLTEVRRKISKDAEDVKRKLQQEVDAFADAIGQKILGRAV
ncbi:MAG: ATPase [Desulfobacteraceae bacterium 4572_123]|nr:MAG: ATPase [Desulfobacteraceae bacterium 4572_123]